MPPQLLLSHAAAVVLDDYGIAAHGRRKHDDYSLRVGIPRVVHEFLQRSLGRGVFLTQQRRESGINLEAQMSTTYIGISMGQQLHSITP